MRKVNAVTEPDASSLPNMQDILRKLRKAKFLSTLELKSAYHQIPLAEEARPITAFTVLGLFQLFQCRMAIFSADLYFQMLQIPEEVMEEALSALMNLELGDAVDGVAMAAAHLLSELRRARDEEDRELLREQPTILELSIDEEEDDEEKLAAPPAAAIPLGYPRETNEAATQAGPAALAEDPS